MVAGRIVMRGEGARWPSFRYSNRSADEIITSDRPDQPMVCCVCGKQVPFGVPARGDGSIVVAIRHPKGSKPGKACRGSRREGRAGV